MRLSRSIKSTVAVAVGATLVGAPAALGCSCAGGAARERLAGADAAFVGVLESERPLGSTGSSAAAELDVFRVERSYKGRLGRRVEVHTVVSGASCGLEVRVGQRVGLLLRRARDGRWQGGLCDQISPAELRAAAAPLPRPLGRGPARLVVGGPFGDVSALSLDRRGRVLGYGRMSPARQAVIATSVKLASCRGGSRAVEMLSGRRTATIRALQGMRRVARLPLDARRRFVAGLSCRERRGGTVAALLTPSSGGPAKLIIARRGRPARVLARGAFETVEFTGQSAVLSASVARRAPVAVSLRTGRTRKLAGPALAGVVMARGGREHVGTDAADTLTLVRGDGSVVRGPKGRAIGWADAHTLIAESTSGDLLVLDRRLAQVRRLPRGRSHGPVAVGGGSVYIADGANLLTAPARRGTLRRLARLPVTGAQSLILVGSGGAAHAAQASRCTRD